MLARVSQAQFNQVYSWMSITARKLSSGPPDLYEE